MERNGNEQVQAEPSKSPAGGHARTSAAKPRSTSGGRRYRSSLTGIWYDEHGQPVL